MTVIHLCVMVLSRLVVKPLSDMFPTNREVMGLLRWKMH